MKSDDDLSSFSDQEVKVNFMEVEDEHEYISKTLKQIIRNKLLLNKRRNSKIYFRVIIVSIMISLYYCLILSLDQEIELVTAKAFHSMIVCLMTFIESFITHHKKKTENREHSSFTDRLYQRLPETHDDLDTKEMMFYNVIYGMLTFTGEILLYYFLSLASVFNLNIGVFYSLTVIFFLFLLLRLPYFGISFGLFQYIGTFILVIFTSILFYLYLPDYNFIVIAFTSITVSLIKFIQYCIFEYLHEKTKNAKKLVKQGTYIDGSIGLLLIMFILVSNKPELMISDMSNIMKVSLASFFFYFAIKIQTYHESHYYFYMIFSSVNFLFVSLFDYLINYRVFSLTQLALVSILSLFSIFSFIE
jgi:hypothetical protein